MLQRTLSFAHIRTLQHCCLNSLCLDVVGFLCVLKAYVTKEYLAILFSFIC